MKNDVNNEHLYSYSRPIEKNINFYLFKDDYLTFYFDDINFNNYKSISVFLKNIKTRELLKCISKIEDNKLIINLVYIANLCTNYEFSIIVILENQSYSTVIYPKLNNNNSLLELIIPSSHNSNIKWYLRFLENGKLRLSTIYLFTGRKNTNNIVLL